MPRARTQFSQISSEMRISNKPKPNIDILQYADIHHMLSMVRDVIYAYNSRNSIHLIAPGHQVTAF